MLWPHVPHGQEWSGGPSQRLTCPTGCRVSTVNEQVARAFGEQGQGGQLEHPGHQAAGQQQGPGLRATQELPGETGEAGPAPPGQSPVPSRARGQCPRSPVPPPSQLWVGHPARDSWQGRAGPWPPLIPGNSSLQGSPQATRFCPRLSFLGQIVHAPFQSPNLPPSSV